MIDGGVGLFRTLGRPEPRALEGLRHSARALGVSWPEGVSYARRRARPRPGAPRSRGLRGPGLARDGRRGLRGLGARGGARAAGARGHRRALRPRHGAPAPARRPRRQRGRARAGRRRPARPPGRSRPCRPCPTSCAATSARARAAERAAVDYVEAVVLAGRVGEVFDAVVVDVRDDRPRGAARRRRPCWPRSTARGRARARRCGCGWCAPTRVRGRSCSPRRRAEASGPRRGSRARRRRRRRGWRRGRG